MCPVSINVKKWNLGIAELVNDYIKEKQDNVHQKKMLLNFMQYTNSEK